MFVGGEKVLPSLQYVQHSLLKIYSKPVLSPHLEIVGCEELVKLSNVSVIKCQPLSHEEGLMANI